jgi:hypothetical protein
MTTALATPAAPKKLNLAEGQYRPFAAGEYTIRVQCVRLDSAYSVVVERRSYRLDDLCGSYPTEQEACAVARLHCQMALAEVTA